MICFAIISWSLNLSINDLLSVFFQLLSIIVLKRATTFFHWWDVILVIILLGLANNLYYFTIFTLTISFNSLWFIFLLNYGLLLYSVLVVIVGLLLCESFLWFYDIDLLLLLLSIIWLLLRCELSTLLTVHSLEDLMTWRCG